MLNKIVSTAKKPHLATLTALILMLAVFISPLVAELRLPAVISDNMVLQSDSSVPIWGWAEPYQRVDVKGSWMTLARSARANADGKWMIKIKSPQAGGPYTIVFQSGKEFIEVKDVLSGEVWFCSGQSNMEFPLKSSNNGERAVAESNIPQIRLFKVPHTIADNPLDDTQAQWKLSSPETSADFSAVGFYYGRSLHQIQNVPIGLIQSTWGGTPAESWVRKETLTTDKELIPILERFANRVLNFSQIMDKYQKDTELWEQMPQETKETVKKPAIPVMRTQSSPASLYNGMVAPIIPYKIKGVIWYQGEANRKRAWQYRKLFPVLIENWRSDWDQGTFPFYFVQLAPYKYGDENEYFLPELREAQLYTMRTVVNTGMAITMDIGDMNDIHPTEKQRVADRLALWAVAKDYGRGSMVHCGPLYNSMVVENDKIRIIFDHLGQGLMSTGGQLLTCFTIAGEDKVFYPADAVIERNTVLVSSPEVSTPAAVRFGWNKMDVPNLFNRSGLPASPFRTDNWPAVTLNEN